MATTAWVTITVDDLEDCVLAPQMTAIRNAALGDDQDDPFDSVMPVIVARVRAEIQGNPANKLSSVENSVPPSLKNQTCWLIVAAMQPRIPALKLTDDQQSLIRDARDYLRRVGKPGGIPVEQPTTEAENNYQSSDSAELAEIPVNNTTNQSGLYL